MFGPNQTLGTRNCEAGIIGYRTCEIERKNGLQAIIKKAIGPVNKQEKLLRRPEDFHADPPGNVFGKR